MLSWSDVPLQIKSYFIIPQSVADPGFPVGGGHQPHGGGGGANSQGS